jgi:hypothetical protein
MKPEEAVREPVPSNAMIGRLGDCASTVTGHAAGALPSTPRNSRRPVYAVQGSKRLLKGKLPKFTN